MSGDNRTRPWAGQFEAVEVSGWKRFLSREKCVFCEGSGAEDGVPTAGQCPSCCGYGVALAIGVRHGELVF